MNKRQRKKNYKKRHGANPPTKKQAEAIRLPRELRKVAEAVKDFFKSMHEAFENIRTMPDAEFEKKMRRLTPEERALALKIRNRGKEPTNGESGKNGKVDRRI